MEDGSKLRSQGSNTGYVAPSTTTQKEFDPEKIEASLKSWEPLAGGAIVIVLGVFAVLDAIYAYNADVRVYWTIPFELSLDLYQKIVFISGVLSALAVIGGALSMAREHYRVAVTGAILGAATGWLWYNWFGLCIGLIGTAMISYASEQFDRSDS